MNKNLSIFAIILMVIPCVLAQNTIVVGSQSQEAAISPLGEAKFYAQITNNVGKDDIFVLELPDVVWSLRTEYTPDTTTGVALSPLETKRVIIYVKPNTDIKNGIYYVELKIRSTETGKTTSQLFSVRVDSKIIDYNVKISSEILEPSSIDPAKTNSVKVLLKNPYNIHLINLSVEASSKFLNKKVIVDIPPKSDKIVEFTLSIDSSTPKQEDLVVVNVKQNGKEMSFVEKTIYIKEYKLPFEQEETIEKGLLNKIHKYSFTNTEGAQKTQDIMIPRIRTIGLLFTTPTAEFTNFDGKNYILWKSVTINARDTYQTAVVEDYRQLAFTVLLIILLIIIYYGFRSPIIIKKKAYAIHKKDTGTNEMKIVLYIKNRSRSVIEKVRILDRLPIIQRVDEDFGPGTPEPKYRRHDKEGIILDWDISLAPKEERIFTYKVKSALPIVGEYTLRPCVVQYGHKNRRTSSTAYTLIID